MNATTNTVNDKTDADVIEATVVANDQTETTETGDWAERAPFTAAFLRQFDNARTKINEQLEAGQKNIDDLQKKAIDLVSQVQERAGKVSEKVGEKVRTEGKEATTKLEGLRKGLGDRLPLKVDLESWLNLPLEARQDVLSALGLASDKQVKELQETVNKLCEETVVLVEAQTAVLKGIIETNAKSAKAPARSTTARKKAAPRKTATAAKSTSRKKPVAKRSTKKVAKAEVAEA